MKRLISALLLSACGGAKEGAASSDNTLSTGVTGQDDRRYLVQAVLVSGKSQNGKEKGT